MLLGNLKESPSKRGLDGRFGKLGFSRKVAFVKLKKIEMKHLLPLSQVQGEVGGHWQ